MFDQIIIIKISNLPPQLCCEKKPKARERINWKEEEKSGAKGNTLNNHQAMGSLRMFGARGLLLIFVALGTNGQLLTEKIPLGEDRFRRDEREKIFCSLRNELLSFHSFLGQKTSISVSYEEKGTSSIVFPHLIPFSSLFSFL